jgi:hypothetical protein
MDRLFTTEWGVEVFSLFRAWHNERALNPAAPWNRLTLAISYSTEAHLFIPDPSLSPFNVGTRVILDDFTAEQIEDLNHRYGAALDSRAELESFRRLVGGNPYLVQTGLHELARGAISHAELERGGAAEGGIFGQHLRGLWAALAPEPELCGSLRELFAGRGRPSENSFYRLRSAGILRGDCEEDAVLRCELYALYLRKKLDLPE